MSSQRYLLAWCGVADMIGSLGEEGKDGPILSALLHDDYDQLCVLYYIDEDRTLTPQSADRDLVESLECCNQLSPDERRHICRSIQNTNLGYAHFEKWLKERLAAAGKQTSITPLYKKLAHLNDTEGIYHRVQKTFDAIQESEGVAEVTIHLSPGTPVMGLVWAFASLEQPHVRIRFISSSRADSAPVCISLPEQWVKRYSCYFNQHGGLAEDDFDIMIHLYGEQRMPILQCMRQLKAEKHVFVHDRQYSPEVMKDFLNGAAFDEILIQDSFGFSQIITALRKYLNNDRKVKDAARIAINLTGGTKIMFAAAYEACKEFNCTALYVNGQQRKLQYINLSKSIPLAPIKEVATFLNLHVPDLKISEPGMTSLDCYPDHEERSRLTIDLWDIRFSYASLYKDIVGAKKKFEQSVVDIQYRGKDSSIDLEVKRALNGEVIIEIGDSRKGRRIYRFTSFPHLHAYLAGAWLEEYCFAQLLPLQKEGVIHDLRMRVMVSLSNQLSQEFDILFTDGNRLYVVECKAGVISGDVITKLKSITRSFGGVLALPHLVTCFEPNKEVLVNKILSEKIYCLHEPNFGKKDKRDKKNAYKLFEALKTRIRKHAERRK